MENLIEESVQKPDFTQIRATLKGHGGVGLILNKFNITFIDQFLAF